MKQAFLSIWFFDGCGNLIKLGELGWALEFTRNRSSQKYEIFDIRRQLFKNWLKIWKKYEWIFLNYERKGSRKSTTRRFRRSSDWRTTAVEWVVAEISPLGTSLSVITCSASGSRDDRDVSFEITRLDRMGSKYERTIESSFELCTRKLTWKYFKSQTFKWFLYSQVSFY